jgi:PhnB protein
MAVKPIPPDFRTVTPHLAIKGCAQAIAFYKKALGAEERFSMPGPGGGIMHAEIKIGDSIVMCADEWPDGPMKSPTAAGTSTIALALYVNDCDASFKRAVDAGATVVMPPTNMFWGDRYGMVKDPFGHVWSFSTHVEDVPPHEMPKRAAEAMKNMGNCGG